MDGAKCRELRDKLGIRQAALAWHCQIDPATLSKWECGVGRLRQTQLDVITEYLAQRLQAAKAEFAALELPELDRAIEQVTQ
jgi:transcriptional regulator with XRE-family HTH domain